MTTNYDQFKAGQEAARQNPLTPFVQAHEVGSTEVANNINNGIAAQRKENEKAQG